MPKVIFNFVNERPRWSYWLLKLINRKRYRRIRDEQHRAQVLTRLNRYAESHFHLAPLAKHPRPCSFKHSGNAGDLIYSLPCVRALATSHPASLHLALDVPLRNEALNHPLGTVMLNKGMYDRLSPLLLAQEYIQDLRIHNGAPVDYDLDHFRNSPLPLERLNISRWYFYFHGVTCDLSQPWLKVAPDLRFTDSIVLARSARYRNTALDHRFLAAYPKLVFLGIESEFEDMRRSLPQLKWHPVGDFLEMACVIAGCKLFIGNQSFPFALAEALKVPRILETDPLGPNVVPSGIHGYDILFQAQFEYLVKTLHQ